MASISTTSPACTGRRYRTRFDPHEVDQFLAILGLRQNHDRPDLRDGLGEDGGRQHWRIVGRPGQIALAQRDVLDPDDPLVRLELGDAIDQEKGAVGQNPFNCGIVERERQVHAVFPSIIRGSRGLAFPRGRTIAPQ